MYYHQWLVLVRCRGRDQGSCAAGPLSSGGSRGLGDFRGFLKGSFKGIVGSSWNFCSLQVVFALCFLSRNLNEFDNVVFRLS